MQQIQANNFLDLLDPITFEDETKYSRMDQVKFVEDSL